MKILFASLALALGAMPVLGQAADGRYIVKFNAGRSDAAVHALHAAGAQVLLSLEPQDAVAARIPEQALQGLQHNPNIEYIEEDVIRTPMALWSDRPNAASPLETVPYGIQMVQADLINSTNEGGRKICIIDSGYSQQHLDLKDGVTNSNTTGTGTWNKDSCGHGSHVAGTISATAGNSMGVVGVVPGVQLHIVKVFGDDNLVDGGNCAWTYSSTLVQALNFCTQAGANITSMSLGGTLKSRTEENAFNSAYNTNNMLHVAAAGNAGNKTTSYPAGYGSVISVAAVDANETVASFSQQNRDVEIAAPGVGVLSTVPWQDVDTLTFTAGSVSGGHVEFSGRTAGTTGNLVDGGQCTAAGAWSGKVVVCQRGTNSFLEKVQNVQSGGGVAAVIYNNVTSDATCGDFLGTLGDGNTSTLPAITVSCADGTAALAHAGGSGTVVSQFVAPSSGYEAWDGTSMATPHVSAVAALVWGCFPTKTNAQIRTALTSTARDKGGAGRDNAYGFGIVQAKAAVQSLGALPNANCAVLGTSKY